MIRNTKTSNPSFVELGAQTKDQFVRNIIVEYNKENIDEFRSTYNNIDVFRSVYLYDSENIREAKKKGPLYFDFDGESALLDLKATINFFINQGCPKESLHCFFSGHKGFHLEIVFDALGIDQDKELNKVNEKIAKELAKKLFLTSLDTGIYDNVRLWRLPKSINSKSSLYKISLTLGELNLPLEEIKKFAQKPRSDFILAVSKPWLNFKEVLMLYKKSLKSAKISGKDIFKPVKEGERNIITFKRALRLKAEGKKFTEALSICLNIKDDPPLSFDEVKRTVASAYNERYVTKSYEDDPLLNEGNEISSSFYNTKDGRICEEIFNQELKESLFVVYDGKDISTQSFIKEGNITIKPINNTLVQSGIIKLPSGILEYESETKLLDEIRNVIHEYVDISEEWEQWASYYVLLSWLYDKLPVCPYFCALGPSDAGKTRLIQTVGSLCYKPFFTSGSITAAAIFRIIDQFKGTLIINEFDHIGDFNSEIIVIFNNGYEKGLPVPRVEGEEKKEVKIYDVYGPKLFSTRKRKNDWAFESRLITIRMRETKRDDIPPFLLEDFNEKALELRNKLLLFRLRHYKDKSNIRLDFFRDIKGRLRQTLLSITSIVNNDEFLQYAQKFAREMAKNLKASKGFDLDAVIYQVLVECSELNDWEPELKEIVGKVKEITGIEKLHPKTVGNIVRDELGLRTKRGGISGNYVVVITKDQLEAIKSRYEVEEEEVNVKDPLSTEIHSVSSESSVIDKTISEHTEVTELPYRKDGGNNEKKRND